MKIDPVKPPKEGAQCTVVRGTHAGKSGVVGDVKTSKTGHVTITVRQASGVRFKTLARNVVTSMKKQLALLITLSFVATALPSQSPPVTAGPLQIYLQRAFSAVAKDVAAAAELMPAEDYGFRPAGAASEVRTFGELVDHVLSINAFNCAMGAGERDPRAALGNDPLVGKANILKALADVNAMCTRYISSLTDSALGQSVTRESGKVTLKSMQATLVIFTIAHANEHYGNIVTYLRAKGLVPPTTPAQVAPFTLVAPPKTGGRE